jgi:hypothetical protein
MKKRFNKVYQFRIDLLGIRPPIWRRIQIPETYTFWGLHLAIQDSMGWGNCHLHEFIVNDPITGLELSIGIKSEDDTDDFFTDDVIPEQKCKISKIFSEENPEAYYIYDFGDYWKHLIVLEKILPKEKDTDYPRCIAGRRACPPEDCGGVWMYSEMLKVIKKPIHPRREEILQYLGTGFDPEHFDPKEVVFCDPDFVKNILI